MQTAVFYVHKTKKLIGMICCHVDDLLHAGDNSFNIPNVKVLDIVFFSSYFLI